MNTLIITHYYALLVQNYTFTYTCVDRQGAEGTFAYKDIIMIFWDTLKNIYLSLK